MDCTYPNCGAPAMLEDSEGRCFWHSTDPATVEQRMAAVSKGGKGSRKVLEPSQVSDLDLALLSDVDKLVARALRETATGNLSTAVGKSVGYLARSLTVIRESVILEERIRVIEQKLEKLGGW